jgi:hypothetical protein
VLFNRQHDESNPGEYPLSEGINRTKKKDCGRGRLTRRVLTSTRKHEGVHSAGDVGGTLVWRGSKEQVRVVAQHVRLVKKGMHIIQTRKKSV